MGKKRGKMLRKAKSWHAEDRISNLPDVLLTYILSFLSTKDSVRTSVLSTRWKSVWVHVPALVLKDSEFPPSGNDLSLTDSNQRKDKFLAFISRFLLQSNISSFRRICLGGLEYYDQSLLESWICASKNPNLEELLLNMKFFLPGKKFWWSLLLSYRPLDPVFQHDNSLLDIGKLCIEVDNCPPSVLESLVSLVKEWNVKDFELTPKPCYYGWQTFALSLHAFEMLVILRLGGRVSVEVPKASILFPNLNILYLGYVEFTDDESTANIITSCPVLEELHFHKKCLESLTITSPTLKNLKVIIGRDDGMGREIVIHAPALEYLELEDYNPEGKVLGHFGAVITAKVGVHSLFAAFEVLSKIPTVKHLSLDCGIWWFTETDSYGGLTFHNLTHLEIKNCSSWLFVIDLLKISPSLTDLFFESVDFGDPDEFDFMSEQDVPHCLLSNLKTIVIGRIQMQPYEIEVIGYFLKNCKVLKQMIIAQPDRRHQEAFEQTVMGIPKGSVSCKIEFDCGKNRWELPELEEVLRLNANHRQYGRTDVDWYF